jgi:hypothetical protein
MRQYSSPIGIFAIACGLLASIATAKARPDTWVSPDGSNSGDCASTAPCRTFAYAYTQTSGNGSINVVSSGSYGPLTISKAISIVADGVEAAIISGANGAAITVQAPPTAIVSLRGLTIDMRGGPNNGISFDSGAALHVQRCVIRSHMGIRFVPDSGTSELYVTDTVIERSSSDGILVLPTGSASAGVVLDRVRVEHGAFSGIHLQGRGTTGSIKATVRDSVAAGNAGAGILANDDGSGTTVMVDRSAFANNGSGVVADGPTATIRIGDSTVSGNTTGLSALSGGVIASYGTNKVNGNGTDGAPSSTIARR